MYQVHTLESRYTESAFQVAQKPNIDLKVWERQAFDTDKSWQAFCVYRDLGPKRSLADVGRLLEKSPKGLDRWSSPHHWVSRAAEYDAWLDQQNRTEKRQKEQIDRVSMLERHTSVAVWVQNKLVERIRKFTEAEWKAVGPKDAIMIFRELSQMERTSRGLPEKVIDVRTPEMLRDQIILEAQLYFDEVIHMFPNFPREKHLQIVEETFDVTREELGISAQPPPLPEAVVHEAWGEQ